MTKCHALLVTIFTNSESGRTRRALRLEAVLCPYFENTLARVLHDGRQGAITIHVFASAPQRTMRRRAHMSRNWMKEMGLISTMSAASR